MTTPDTAPNTPKRPATLSLRELCVMLNNDNPEAIASWLQLRPGWTLDTEVGAKASIALKFLVESTRPEVLDKRQRRPVEKNAPTPSASTWTPGQTVFTP